MRKVTTKPPLVTNCELLGQVVEIYNEASEKEYAEAAFKEGLTVEEWMNKKAREKRKEVKE